MFQKRWLILPLIVLMLALNLGGVAPAFADTDDALDQTEPALVDNPSAESEPVENHGVMATYHGKTIDLAEGWGDAQICVEFAVDDVRCYENDAELAEDAPEASLAGTRSAHTCPFGFACLWQHTNYRGRRLQWRDKGRKLLSDWKFRDQASSAYNNRRQFGFVLEDFRARVPNPKIPIGTGLALPDLTKVRYLYGGNWNNKVDAVTLP